MPGDRKSGIPAEVEIPAPARTTMLFGGEHKIYCAIPDREREESVWGGVFASIRGASGPNLAALTSFSRASWSRFRWAMPSRLLGPCFKTSQGLLEY